ncbi:MAG: hypothetical protein Q4A92_09365 [Corynebacterium sp.]|nr:hypothetical protein [Corynebacterium sp.]
MTNYNPYGLQQPQPNTPPKKSNTGLIIGIIVAALLLVMLMVAAIAIAVISRVSNSTDAQDRIEITQEQSDHRRNSSGKIPDYSDVKAKPNNPEWYLSDDFSKGHKTVELEGRIVKYLGSDAKAERVVVTMMHDDGTHLLEGYEKNDEKKLFETRVHSCSEVVGHKYVFCTNQEIDKIMAINIENGEVDYDIPVERVYEIQAVGHADGKSFLFIPDGVELGNLIALDGNGKELWRKTLDRATDCGLVKDNSVVFCVERKREASGEVSSMHKISMFSLDKGDVREREVAGRPKMYADGWGAALDPDNIIQYTFFDFDNKELNVSNDMIPIDPIPQFNSYDILKLETFGFPLSIRDDVAPESQAVINAEGDVVYQSINSISSPTMQFVEPGKDEVKLEFEDDFDIKGLSRSGKLVLIGQNPGEGKRKLILKDVGSGQDLLNIEEKFHLPAQIENGLLVYTTETPGGSTKLSIHFPGK